MTLSELMLALTAPPGVQLKVDAGRLRFRPPHLTDDLRAALKQHKAELLAFLNGERPGPCLMCGCALVVKRAEDRWRCAECEPTARGELFWIDLRPDGAIEAVPSGKIRGDAPTPSYMKPHRVA